MDVTCEQLNAFLNGDLAPVDARRFEGHASVCAECRDAIDEQRWIDGLLCSPERTALESPRPAMVGEIESALSQSKQWAGVLAYGLAAAAVVFLAVGWIVFAGRGAEKVASTNANELKDSPRVVSEDSVSQQVEKLAVDAPPRAVVDGGDDMIVVAIESPYPDVTIVRVYPIYKPDLTTDSSTLPPADDVFHWSESL
jgi:hypothetical protein